MNDLDLDEIEARAKTAAVAAAWPYVMEVLTKDVPVLIAAIRKLRDRSTIKRGDIVHEVFHVRGKVTRIKNGIASGNWPNGDFGEYSLGSLERDET